VRQRGDACGRVATPHPRGMSTLRAGDADHESLRKVMFDVNERVLRAKMESTYPNRELKIYPSRKSSKVATVVTGNIMTSSRSNEIRIDGATVTANESVRRARILHQLAQRAQ
jgi:hypothetical protein